MVNTCTNFGEDSSSRFPFWMRTHKHTHSHRHNRSPYSANNGVNNNIGMKKPTVMFTIQFCCQLIIILFSIIVITVGRCKPYLHNAGSCKWWISATVSV